MAPRRRDGISEHAPVSGGEESRAPDQATLDTPPQTHKGAGHRSRLRERFLASGLDGFLDYEVIELLLTLNTPRRDCKEPAKAALTRFKTLQGVLSAPLEELTRVPGIGPKNALGIKLIEAVAARHLEGKILGKDPIRSAREMFDYLYLRLRDRQTECFTVIYLDAQNRALSVETLFEGTLTTSHVYPREVVRAALSHNAAALLLAHNHPSGEPRPSPADIHITRELVFACRLMGVRVLEHLIIGDNHYYSFAEKGYIADFNRELDRRDGLQEPPTAPEPGGFTP
ncbi:MAG: DNA repair protein RadC [Proteobacteria bacterium]|nr:DNA repair protein RadC [Pseudomonadota bacterium]